MRSCSRSPRSSSRAPVLPPRSGPLGGSQGLLARPQLWGPLDAVPVPVHVAGGAASAAGPLRWLATGLTEAHWAWAQRPLAAVPVPVVVARVAAPGRWLLGQPPTVRARARAPYGPRLQRSLDAVEAPVLVTGRAESPAAVLGQPPTMETYLGLGAGARELPRRLRRPFRAMMLPVVRAHLAAPAGQVAPGRDDPPTDPAGACRHPHLPSDGPTRANTTANPALAPISPRAPCASPRPRPPSGQATRLHHSWARMWRCRTPPARRSPRCPSVAAGLRSVHADSRLAGGRTVGPRRTAPGPGCPVVHRGVEPARGTARPCAALLHSRPGCSRVEGTGQAPAGGGYCCSSRSKKPSRSNPSRIVRSKKRLAPRGRGRTARAHAPSVRPSAGQR
jgi:hypothetical protein